LGPFLISRISLASDDEDEEDEDQEYRENRVGAEGSDGNGTSIKNCLLQVVYGLYRKIKTISCAKKLKKRERQPK
jgi:hypothetical protein